MKALKPAAGLLGALILFTVLAGCNARKPDVSAPAGWPQELVMCYLPNEASEELAEYRSALQGALSAALGINVREINAADYNAVVEAMRT
ncbi:MAG: hypothetical protein LBK27_08860, partial [Treponema sp.]|nr:hypothetical protein [Treponema sp.]